MKKIMPIGPRIFVEDNDPVTTLEERAKAVNLELVILEENIPQPTSGRVVAVGSDPLIQDLVSVGDEVTFSRHSTTRQYVEGKEYRVLTINEIISVIREVLSPEESSSGQSAAQTPPDTPPQHAALAAPTHPPTSTPSQLGHQQPSPATEEQYPKS